jgi:signal transduction histidine kinase/CheY-like chemotaxis protein
MTVSLPRASLRTFLLALTAGAVVPVVCFAVYLIIGLGRTQQEAVERGIVETAAALAIGVDRELLTHITTLEAIAASELLDSGEPRAFLREARRVLDSQAEHGWLSINLASPDGTPLANSLRPVGPPIPLLDVASVKEAAGSGKPAVSDLLSGGIRDQPAFAVRVPVIRDGAVRYVLSATMSARSVAGALSSQQDVPDRIAVLYDRRGTIVFRTVNAAQLIGTPVTPRLAQESAVHTSGVFDDVNLEGTPVRVVFQRARVVGWSVAVGVPHRALYAAQRQSTRDVLMAGAVVLALSVASALVVARGIRRSVLQLVTAADTLSAPGDTPPAPIDTPITELARLGDAFVDEGRLIRERGVSLERQLAELRVAREAAEAGNRAKDEFLALLSHELRTPLNAVYGWARVLQNAQVNPETARRALDAIVRNANAQVQLIDDLLDVSRVTAGKMRLDVRTVDLKAVIEDALDAVRPAAEAKGIALQGVLDASAGMVTGDAARLQQVVWNLLMNAVKFTDKAGRVTVHLQRRDARAEIVVVDTGLGIRADVLPFVFDRFRQADSSSTRAHGGLGLGLALVKQLVELHGGTVSAQSAGEGRGSTFTVALPLARTTTNNGVATRVRPSAETAAPLSARRLDGLRVLVVDDDADALDLATEILAGAGAIVSTCASAPEALAAVQQWRPDVLVSDIEMPGEDGYALIRKLRALDAERGGTTPAVALSAYGRTQDRIGSLTAGYNMHVPKPVDPGEFTTIVATVAGRSTA